MSIADIISLIAVLSLLLNSAAAEAILCSEDGEVKLVDGPASNDGKVEICINGHWSSVCDDSAWGSDEISILCKDLGYTLYGTSKRAGYGRGSGLVYSISCSGDETQLSDCMNTLLPSCSKLAGVTCYNESQCNETDVRLVDGATSNTGRVEICLDDLWGSVCDDYWDLNDAIVVCRQLKYNGVSTPILMHPVLSNNSLFYHLDNVQCTGDENRLSECRHRGIGIHNCRVRQDEAGVNCTNIRNCNETDVRLVDGATSNTGRVEICLNDLWGSVCDDYWGLNDAIVVCRQLKYYSGFSTAIVRHPVLSNDSLFYHLDNVQCTGDENRLSECSHNGIGYHNCRVRRDEAGVNCSHNQNCNETDVRLVDGATSNTGRVEICLNDLWGSVCDDYWDLDDAIVVCRQLKYKGSSTPILMHPVLSNDSLFYHLDNVRCTGDENRLSECSHRGIGIHNCRVRQDEAGVNCSHTLNCNANDVRLVDGATLHDGRVEMCVKNHWKPVCSDSWDIADVIVVCRQLQYNQSISESTYVTSYYGSYSNRINYVHCIGNETTLSECEYNENSYCSNSARVSCNKCNDTDVRLVDGSSLYGEVEVCYNGYWGAACTNSSSDGWSHGDARVVCRQLGYEGPSLPTRGVIYKTSNFRLYSFSCGGNESLLFDCPHYKYLKQSRCLRARVLCNYRECNEGDIKVVEGKTPNEGKLEVCVKGEWGSLCDIGWNNHNSQVACQQLGYNGMSYPLLRQNRPNRGYYILANTSCNGDESILTECPHSGFRIHQCSTGPAGVLCMNIKCEEGSVHLVGSDDPSRGRVEYCYNGTWHSVCADGWSNINGSEAKAVCHSLGFNTSLYGSAVIDYGESKSNNLPQLNITCNSHNKLLSKCSVSEMDRYCTRTAGVDCIAPCVTKGLTDCSACSNYYTYCRNYASNCWCGISCLKYGSCCSDYSVVRQCEEKKCEHGSVHLVGGLTDSTGRVEVCAHGVWGRVCDGENWGLDNARVVCRQLGFSDKNAYILEYDSRFGTGGEYPVIQDVYCAGTEQELLDCSHSRIGYHRCFKYRSVNVEIILIDFNDTIISCYDEERGCRDGQVRLQGGSDPSNGYVEICKDQRWGRVCSDGWDITEAQVMCRELNYSSGEATLIDGPLDVNDSITFFEEVECNSAAKHLNQCVHQLSQDSNCSSAAMACEDIIHTKTCSEGTTTSSLDKFLRYGECSVYESETEICDGLLELGTDYVYVSHKLGNQKTLSDTLNGIISETEAVKTLHGQICVEQVYKILCHYYLPPCGNSLETAPPTAVCFGKCQSIEDECSFVWNAILTALRNNDYPINCRDTSKILFPVKHCCSKDQTKTQTSNPAIRQTETDGGMVAGIVIAILFIVALITGGVVVSFFIITKHQRVLQMKRVQCDIMPEARYYDGPQLELTHNNKGLNEARDGAEDTILTTTLANSNTYSVSNTTPEITVDDHIMYRARLATYQMRELARGKFLVKKENITLMDCIGEGEFGVVYKAKLGLSHREVAVKTVKGEFDQVEVDKFVEESLKLSRFKHSHIMGLIGVCLDAGPAPYIIMPYMANGSLLSFLKRERKKLVIVEEMDEVDVTEITKRLMVMCHQISSGMEYLATEKYIHRDLAARNCMIDTHFLIKITDFGLSEDIFERNYFRQESDKEIVKLPIKWMAPESLSDGHFSEKSDVWSYGVTMWEIFSGGKAPYPGTDPLTLIQSLEQGHRMPQPYNSACNEEIYGIMKSCWEIVPEDRPTFKELSLTVLKYIEHIAGYLQISFNPFSDEQDFRIGRKAAK